MIAEPRLHPDVREAVATLLGRTTFIEAASWADKVRNTQTAPWHYVNIEITKTEYDAARVCPQQLAKAGVRLAKVLNDALGKK
jgi:S1/P1 Nuclease